MPLTPMPSTKIAGLIDTLSVLLVPGRVLDVVDDDELASAFDTRELQAELLLDGFEQRGFGLNVRRAGPGGDLQSLVGQIFQADIELTCEARLIDDRAARDAEQPC